MNLFKLLFIASVTFSFTAVAGELRGNEQAGKAIFNQNCVVCHGATGKGDGPAAAGLNPKPANFSDPARRDMTESRQLRVVTGGGAVEKLSPLMPSFSEALTDQQIKDVITYVRDNFISKEVTQR